MNDRPQVCLHHGCISVADLDRSIEFYSRVLGFELESRRYLPGISLEIAFLRSGRDRIEIVCHDEPQALPEFAKTETDDFRVIGTKHLSFGTDDPDGLHVFLAGQGVEGLTEIFENNPSYRYFFFRDPDGIGLEVVSPKRDA